MGEVKQLFQTAVRVVADEERLSVRAVLHPRGWRAKRARRTAAYLAVVSGDVSVKRLARTVGLAKSGLQKAVRAVEDLRDDARFDARITRLEARFHDAHAL